MKRKEGASEKLWSKSSNSGFNKGANENVDLVFGNVDLIFMSSDPVTEIVEFMESCGITEKLANIKRQKEGR